MSSQRECSGFDIRYPVAAASRCECQIQNSTRNLYLLASLGSDIRKRTRRDGVRMLEPGRQCPNLSIAACLRMAIGPTAAQKTRAINTGAKSRDVSHGRPVQSRGWLPLPTCQNKGFPRVLSPLTRRQSWLTSGYQRGFWSGEIPAGQGLKTACKPLF